PVALKAFSPARTSFHSIVLPCFFAAASSTSWAAGQMSTPVPSPSMNGMMGSFGTFSVPSADIEIFVAIGAAAYLWLEERTPRGRAEEAALPLVADREGIVHERARLLQRGRRLRFEEPEQRGVVEHLLEQDRLGTTAATERHLETRLDAQQL